MGSDEICVLVEFCGVNFSDIYVRQGFLRELTVPRILGSECVGTVDVIGKNVKNFQVRIKFDNYITINHYYLVKFWYMFISYKLILLLID